MGQLDVVAGPGERLVGIDPELDLDEHAEYRALLVLEDQAEVGTELDGRQGAEIGGAEGQAVVIGKPHAEEFTEDPRDERGDLAEEEDRGLVLRRGHCGRGRSNGRTAATCCSPPSRSWTTCWASTRS